MLLFATTLAACAPPSQAAWPRTCRSDAAVWRSDPNRLHDVLIDFSVPPDRSAWLSLGIADCTYTSCRGLVPTWRLRRMCGDTNVRDVERVPPERPDDGGS
jgi:hypothetical protein